MNKLLVAVDGSEANRAALDWAVLEAERTGASLTIAVAAEPWQVAGPYPPNAPETDFVQPVADRAVEAAGARLGTDRVVAEVHHGHSVRVVLDLAEDHDTVVVGKRGLGALRRVLVGSTSIAVAGRSPVPVVVIPDEWDTEAAATRPILVGMDLEKEHDRALERAFSEAEQRGVGLQVLQGWQPHPLLVGEAGVAVDYYVEWQQENRKSLEAYVARIGQGHPDVEVRVDQELGHPVHLLSDRAEQAQLLVLGRESKERWSGFTLGSVARGVLHHAEVPVVIVPAG